MSEYYSDLEQALRVRGEFIAPICGVSMLPMLEQERDAVRLVYTRKRLAVGDLPLYRRRDGKLVLHRILKVERDGYLVCGDNCTDAEHIPFEAVIAVTVGYFKGGRYVPCDDRGYRRYVKRRIRGRILRVLRANVARLLHGVHRGSRTE